VIQDHGQHLQRKQQDVRGRGEELVRGGIHGAGDRRRGATSMRPLAAAMWSAERRS
jgi:hypothetical protein